MRPAFATTVRPDLATATRWANDARIAPGHRLLRRANGPVFVAVGVLHQDRADEVGPELAGEGRGGSATRTRSRGRPAGARRRSRSRRRRGNAPHSGPAGFFSSAISSAEQHIVQGPQDLPGAAAMCRLHCRRRSGSNRRRLALHPSLSSVRAARDERVSVLRGAHGAAAAT